MSALPPFQPKPKKVTFAAPVMMADPYAYGEGSSSGYPLLMMIRREATYEAVQYSHKRRPQELLSFNPHTRSFTCKGCNEECVAPAIAHNRPTHVFCRSCNLVYYSAAQLPAEWMHTSIWDVRADAAPENPLAIVVYEEGAFGSSIAGTSSYAQSDRQVGPVSRALPPIRTAPPAAPTKSTGGAAEAKLARLFPLVVKGKQSAMAEYERLLVHIPAEEREEHLAQCRQHNVALACFKREQPAEAAAHPVPQRPAVMNTQPRITTPARPLPNRFATPGLQGLLTQAKQYMEEAAATKAPAHSEPTLQLNAAPATNRAEQLQAAGWQFAPIPEDKAQDDTNLATSQAQKPGSPTVTVASPSSRGDEDPYREGDTYTQMEQPGAQQAAGGEQPATINPSFSPRTSEPDLVVLPAWQTTTEYPAIYQPSPIPILSAFLAPVALIQSAALSRVSLSVPYR
jgi:hypothetical protein